MWIWQFLKVVMNFNGLLLVTKLPFNYSRTVVPKTTHLHNFSVKLRQAKEIVQCTKKKKKAQLQSALSKLIYLEHSLPKKKTLN